ncbi:unnamed protein product [Chrysodeixis includens]|uniref:PDZ domain-containing protein n=1 Tax=Chrysodeixis includens TaxID=689277 RepID=A0A9P0BXF5_CHRIL|nr:unnamed protein product [Chrysodeixis includens]
MQVFGEWAQVEVVELVNDGSGLAFGIVGGRSSGVVVKSVLPGGVADRDGRLRSGDMLLRIGAVSVVGMCARQAAAVLRQCGACVRLLVARPATGGVPSIQPLGASPAPVVPSRLLADPIELERRLAEAGHDGFGALCEDTSPPSPPPTIIEERLHHRPVASIVAVVPRGALAPSPRPPPAFVQPPQPQPQPMRLPLDMAVRGTGEPETLSYDVELNKDSALGLGITVAGYVCEQEELSGIFVKSISEGSSADLCGKIQVNDRIVEVDGVSLHGVTNHRAVALLRDAKGPVVRLKALRYLRGAGFEKLQKALAAQDGRRSPIAPPSPSVTSLAKYSFSVYDESTVIEAEPESGLLPHMPSPMSPSEEAEIVIGRDDEVSEREARRIQDKWRDILRQETDWPGHQYQYDIVVSTIIKEKDSGLGISLEGTVRVVGGKEVQARHYIRAIAPNGPVARLGMYRVGDELLEVNGWRVLGAHHVEVVTRLRAVTSPVLLVVVRKREQYHNHDDRMPDSSFARSNIVGGSLQELLAPPQRLIKAKSESSVASLCSATTVMSAPHDHDGMEEASYTYPQSNIVGGSLQELLAPPQRLIKAKSESSVASLCSATTVMSAPHDHDGMEEASYTYPQSNIVGGSLQELLAPPQRLIKAKSESSVASLCSATTSNIVGGSLQELPPPAPSSRPSPSSVASLCSATTVMSAPHDHDGAAAPPQRLIKAKSESSVASLCSATTVMSAPHDHDGMEEASYTYPQSNIVGGSLQELLAPPQRLIKAKSELRGLALQRHPPSCPRRMTMMVWRKLVILTHRVTSWAAACRSCWRRRSASSGKSESSVASLQRHHRHVRAA